MRSITSRIALLAALSLTMAAHAQTPEEIGGMVSELQGAILRDQPMSADFQSVVDVGPEALDHLDPLLEGRTDLRIAGALIVAQIAVKSNPPRAEDMLVRFADDSSPAVAYWGYYGLLNSEVLPEPQAEQWILRSLEKKRPLAIRLMGCREADERKLESAVPWLAEIIRTQAPHFERLKAKIFVEEVEITPEPQTDPRRPAPRGRFDEPDEPFEPEPWEVEDEYLDEYGTEERMQPEYETRPIDPLETRRSTVAQAGTELERQPEVEQIRRAGLAMESITGENFGFATTPSWDLGEVIPQANEWFERNRPRYEDGPDAEPADADEPETPEPAGADGDGDTDAEPETPEPAGGRRGLVPPG